jgi:KTSC domain
MKLSKLDLSNILAIAHSNGHLQLLVDRGSELEFLEIAAPVQAYEGLQLLNEIVADCPELPLLKEPIAMLPVSSSMASAVGYDNNENILQVEFHNGTVYQYEGVEPETWKDFYCADSVGSFFNEQIKGQYESERIDEDHDYY